MSEVMKEGGLVNTKVVLELLQEAVERSYNERPHSIILLDGFPRFV